MHFTTLRDLHYLSRSYMHQTRQMQKVYRATESKAVLELQRGVDNISVRTMPLHYMCLQQHHAKKHADPQEKGRNSGATGVRLHRLPITNTVARRCRNESKIVLSALYHSSPRSQCKLVLEGCPCTIIRAPLSVQSDLGSCVIRALAHDGS